MTDFRIIVLISAIVYFVLAIILGGILFTEYCKRGKKFRSGILGYGVFLIVIFGFYFSDIYRNLISPSVLVNWICLFLAFLASVLFILTSFKYFRYLNKKLFFSISVFAVSIIVIEILRLLHVNKSFEIYTAIVTLMATIFTYLLIVGFLINTSRTDVKK